MADVMCTRCGEPWDTYHLRHDEIWEAVSENLISESEAESWDGSLKNPTVAVAFEKLGWRFAGSVYAVLQCPCCKEKEPLQGADERGQLVTIMADLFGDDEDALINAIEDFA